MTLPNVFLVGAPKCGTTSLASWLGEHPAGFLSVPKEPYFWAADYPRMRAHYGFETRSAYEALYAAPQAQQATVRVDGSTTYLYSQFAVADIMAAVPDPRFVVAVRNPVDLLVSYHRTQLVALNENEPDFGTAWRRSLRGGLPPTDPLDPKLLDYRLVGQLGAALERLLAVVPRERVHVVMFDDLVRDLGATWQALTAFLQIDGQPEPAFDVYNASNKTARFTRLRRLTHRPPAVLAAPIRRLRQWSRTTDNPRVAAAKAKMWRPTETPTVAAEVRAEVADELKADVVRLAGLLERDLSVWSGASR